LIQQLLRLVSLYLCYEWLEMVIKHLDLTSNPGHESPDRCPITFEF
jgi:hypothetical protein